ncbi:C39 family peptidase [Desulfolutivibrio sp.]|uniref:C39 family peptidase n=1 Tax=Desulfolutivibrio sp. TaxID=2773296 RepID=UPI002F968AC5
MDLQQARQFNKFLSKARFPLILCLAVLVCGPYAAMAQDAAPGRAQATVESVESGKYYTLRRLSIPGEAPISEMIISGPPTPPPGYEAERVPVDLAKAAAKTTIKILTAPAFNWVFGCSSVSGAMIAAYYDRNGFPNMYTGPTDGGVMPLNNSVWGTWSDGTSTYPNLPLAASHNGVDGRTTKGSIDDYWIKYGSEDSDPYISGGWTQHAWSDAIGDYMKTSQSYYDNSDGSTTFYSWTSSATPLTCADMESGSIDTLDGTYGRKLFYEARGYTVTDCYNQKTDNAIAEGFSFAQYKAEIDAGRPVMINVTGHTMAGVGYDDATNTIYIHDTWDYTTHTMPWGGSYSGMTMWGVSIVNLAPVATASQAQPWELLLLNEE